MTRLGLAAIVVAAAVPIAMLGTGVAAADDYTGETYADASAAIAAAGGLSKIGSRDGATLPDDQCVVTHAEQAHWRKGDDFRSVTSMVLLDLNCNAGVALPKNPGNSAASPQGRAAKAGQG